MIKIKNEAEKAILYISGSIVDDEEGGWYSTFREGDTTGYEYPAKIKEQLEKIDKNAEIEIHINSYGGSVFAGVAIANYISKHKGRTIAICDGIAASIATQIFFSADICQIPGNAYIFMHKPECMEIGNAEDFRKAADTLDTIQRGLETTYQKKAKEGVTAEQITELVNQESWLTGQEASEYFNIQVLDAVKAVNCVGSAEKLRKCGIKNIPSNLHFLNERPQPPQGGSGVPKSIKQQEMKIKIALARAKGALI